MIGIRKTISIFVLVLFISALSACEGPNETSIEARTTFQTYQTDSQRYLYPVFDKVDIEKDLVYTEETNFAGEKEKLTLDIYQPAGDTLKGRPAIIWIHGGGFSGGSKDSGPTAHLSYEFARRGYVTVSINYRLRQQPGNDWPGTFSDANSDAKAALNWLRKNSDKYGVDKHHIAVGGDSAGGNIAINLAYCGDTSGEGVDNNGIFAVIDMYGPYMWAQLKRQKTPVFIIHGDKDTVVPYQQSVDLEKNLEKAGIYHEFFTMQGEGHNVKGNYWDDVLMLTTGFLFNTLNSTAGPVLRYDRDIIHTTPGESISAILKKTDGNTASSGAVDISLPEGWQLDEGIWTPTGKNGLELKIRIPSDCRAGSYFVLNNQPDEGSEKTIGAILPVIVSEPVSILLKPDLGEKNEVQTSVSIRNNSTILSRSGHLSINDDKNNKDAIDFSGLNPGEIETFLIPYRANTKVDIGIALDDGYSENVQKDLNFLVIPFENPRPEIDGKIDDWKCAPGFVIDQQRQVAGMNDWGGPGDLSGKVYFQWDDDNLYLAAGVIDSIHSQNSIEGNIWQGDSIQLAVDVRQSFDAYSSGYNEFGFALNENTGSTEKWRWLTPDGQQPGAVPDILCAISRVKDTTCYELAIPWKYITKADVKNKYGMKLGLSFLINDSDGKARRGWMEYGGGIGDSKNTGLFVGALLKK